MDMNAWRIAPPWSSGRRTGESTLSERSDRPQPALIARSTPHHLFLMGHVPASPGAKGPESGGWGRRHPDARRLGSRDSPVRHGAICQTAGHGAAPTSNENCSACGTLAGLAAVLVDPLPGVFRSVVHDDARAAGEKWLPTDRTSGIGVHGTKGYACDDGDASLHLLAADNSPRGSALASFRPATSSWWPQPAVGACARTHP